MKLKEEEAAAAASIDAASGGGQNVGNLNDRMGTGMDPKSTANRYCTVADMKLKNFSYIIHHSSPSAL